MNKQFLRVTLLKCTYNFTSLFIYVIIFTICFICAQFLSLKSGTLQKLLSLNTYCQIERKGNSGANLPKLEAEQFT